MDKHWFVFYTKSRQEKKVRDLLEKHGYEVFLPTQKVMRQWSDRKKKVDVPLFNSYLFVRVSEYEIQAILAFPGVAWIVRFNGKPAILRLEELTLIERFLATGLLVEVGQVEVDNLKAGDKAEILDGPLKGVKGMLSSSADTLKFNVILEGINQVVRLKISGYLLKKT